MPNIQDYELKQPAVRASQALVEDEQARNDAARTQFARGPVNEAKA